MATKAHLEGDKRYHDKLDNIQFRAPKGFREEIAEHAKSRGESKTAFIIRAIRETMERDKETPPANDD